MEELKYKIAWLLTLGSDSRFGNVAVWIMVAEGTGLNPGAADSSCRSSRARTSRVSWRRGRRPSAGPRNGPWTEVGPRILHFSSMETPSPAKGAHGAIPRDGTLGAPPHKTV